jgi:hypothetical protein
MDDKENFYKKIIKSSYVGVSLVIFTFTSNHPFDYLKTVRQANISHNKSNRALVSEVYSLYGIKGFYTGGKTNFARAVLKEAYRNPVRGILKGFYSEKIPKSVQIKFPEIRNIATGVSMAFFDTFILCPLERIKVWVMTVNTNKKKPLISYFSQKDVHLLRDLFKGLKVSFIKSAASWTSYLVFEEDIRKYVTKNNVNKVDISISQQILIGFLAGFVNSVITMPFDTIKTQIQKCGSNSDKTSIFLTLKSIYKTNGILGLYSGWFFRFPSYIIVALITSHNIQKIDKIWNIEE